MLIFYFCLSLACIFAAAIPAILWKARRNTALDALSSEEAKAARSHAAALEFLGQNGVFNTKNSEAPLHKFMTDRNSSTVGGLVRYQDLAG